MKLALIGALAAVLMAPAVFAGETLDRVDATKVLKVATNAGWPPQSYLDDSNQLVGFDIDVANEIAKRSRGTPRIAGRRGPHAGFCAPDRPGRALGIPARFAAKRRAVRFARGRRRAVHRYGQALS